MQNAKSHGIFIRLPTKMVEVIDQIAREEQRSRNAQIRFFLQEYLAQHYEVEDEGQEESSED